MTYTVHQIIFSDEQVAAINSSDTRPEFYTRYLRINTHQRPEMVAEAFAAGDYVKACEIRAWTLEDCFKVGNIGPQKFIKKHDVRMHSLSVGDVIEVTETAKRFLICSFGFTDLN